jgi:hypothetical protein
MPGLSSTRINQLSTQVGNSFKAALTELNAAFVVTGAGTATGSTRKRASSAGSSSMQGQKPQQRAARGGRRKNAAAAQPANQAT